MEKILVYFDIAALVIFVIVLFSLWLRKPGRSRLAYLFFCVVALFTVTCFFNFAEEVLGELERSAHMVGASGAAPGYAPSWWLPVLSLGYYATRHLAAPAYLLFIVSATNTSHLIRKRPLLRVALLVPCLAVLLVICSNPLTHAIFTYDAYGSHRAPGIGLIYASALLYSLIAVFHLARWRKSISVGQFVALMSLFPLNAIAVAIQYFHPTLHVEMFAQCIAVLMVAMIVHRPESQIDPLSGALSYASYADVVRSSFVTGLPLSLTYLLMENYEAVRRRVGEERYYQLLRKTSAAIGAYLPRDAELFYLRSGIFCAISPQRDDHDVGLSRSLAEKVVDALALTDTRIEARACVVQVPDDVSTDASLRRFSSRIARLLPASPERVTTFAELAQSDQFRLRMDLDSIVTSAIERDGFEMWLQPIYCVRTGTFRSAEALIRLIDEKYGFVSPALFIPEAEQMGQIDQIGDFVLRETTRIVAEDGLAGLGLDYVEINLSVEQCMQDGLARRIEELAGASGLAASQINLEITETATGYSDSRLERNVELLAREGYAFSIDDYGTGYSNLARLMKLPFSLVKIDKSLVDSLNVSSMAQVVASTVEMMHSIGKEVLAEGVETREQFMTLKEMGADYIQGFYFARPMPAPDLVAFLEEHLEGVPA